MGSVFLYFSLNDNLLVLLDGEDFGILSLAIDVRVFVK